MLTVLRVSAVCVNCTECVDSTDSVLVVWKVIVLVRIQKKITVAKLTVPSLTAVLIVNMLTVPSAWLKLLVLTVCSNCADSTGCLTVWSAQMAYFNTNW